MPETALLGEVPEIEHLAEKWRTQYDPVAVRGVPAHITALFPFAPTSPLAPPTIEWIRKVLKMMTLAPFGRATIGCHSAVERRRFNRWATGARGRTR